MRSKLPSALCTLAIWSLAGYLCVRTCFGMALEVAAPAGGDFGFTPAGFAAALAALIALLTLRHLLWPHRAEAPRPGARGRLTRRGERIALALILTAHGFLATRYSWDLPLFEGPDEKAHFDYARYIAREGTLPSLALGEGSDEADVDIAQKIQPPGYYLLLAPLLERCGATRWSIFLHPADPGALARKRASKFRHGTDELRPYRGDILALHLVRLSGILFSLAALLGLRRALREARFARTTVLALVAAIACLPQLLHLAGVLNNDLPAIALGAWIVALGLRWARRRTLSGRSALALGLLLGAAAITKLSAFVFAPWLAALAALLIARGAAPARLLRSALLIALGCALVSGWYWWHNFARYGHPLQNWLYQNANQEVAVGFDPWTRWAVVFPGTFCLSFLCDLGWARAWPSAPILLALGIALFVWIAPLASLQRARRVFLAPRVGPARLAALALVVLAWIAQVRFNASIFQPYGRHHFPFLAAYAVLGACALEAAGARLGAALPRLSPARLLGILQVLLVALSLAFALYGWLGVVRGQFLPLNGVDDPCAAVTDEVARRTPTEWIELLDPPDGAHLNAAPTFRWRAEDGALYSLEIGRTGDFEGPDYRLSKRVLRTYEHLGIKLRGGEYALAEQIWRQIAVPGRAIAWRLRRLQPVRAPGLGASPARRMARAR